MAVGAAVAAVYRAITTFVGSGRRGGGRSFGSGGDRGGGAGPGAFAGAEHDPARGGVAVQSLTLSLVQIVVALSVNAVMVVTAGSVAGALARRPRWLRVQRYFMGTVLAGLAVRLLTDRTRPA
ncbi:hypothetical protein [Saccharopolyspora phatthalungensis]|uniref:LysE type translocator n=1 Tax=Saccharopolyspora phatthalungensis TaxID=664693 RepID=A0A840QBX2_9PSEU|nr:hypothetical protein [Saccharopolyspora phatthalungensis]MBB5158244.1 hypothetical protein [Saccharopolyspora phatthalungensis]